MLSTFQMLDIKKADNSNYKVPYYCHEKISEVYRYNEKPVDIQIYVTLSNIFKHLILILSCSYFQGSTINLNSRNWLRFDMCQSFSQNTLKVSVGKLYLC